MNKIVRKDKRFKQELQPILTSINPKLICRKGKVYAADTRQIYRKINKANIFYNPKQEKARSIGFQKRWLREEMGFDLEKENINWNMFALFHEVGHIMTDNQWLNQRKRINKNRKSVIEDKNKSYEGYCDYFNLEDEKMASEWSINYIRKNKDVINKLQKLL